METLFQDIRFGFRMLAKRPGFTLIAALALALGIGANSTIFSVVNALLLRPLPYHEAERLVWIWGTNPSNNIPEETASPPDYADWKNLSQSFESMGAFARTSVILAGDGEPERLLGGIVTDGFFDVLGAPLRFGRVFTPQEDLPNAERTVILSQGLWRRRFGADPEIIGKSIQLSGNLTTIVGVTSKDFRLPRPGEEQNFDLLLPFRLDFAQANRRSDFLGVIARLRPEVSISQARAELDQIASGLAEQYPATNAGWSTKVITLHERIVGDVRNAVIFLMVAVGFLLLIACSNVANLLLARAATRRKEIAVRAALGAGRGRILRQLMTESLMLSLIGGTLGLALAAWGVEALVRLSPANLPRADTISLDWRVVIFTLAVSVFTGVLFGLAPAIQSSSPQLSEFLKEGGRDSSQGASGHSLRSLLAAGEIAVALVLLIGAGLMARSFATLQRVNPGFNGDGVVTMQVQISRSKYKEDTQMIGFYDQLVERVSTLPGIEACGLVDDIPLSGNNNAIAFVVDGRPPLPPDAVQDAESYNATAEYFRALTIPIRRGRLFEAKDRAGAPLAVIINEAFARRYFPDEDPLGRRINTGNPQANPWATIICVVGDVRHDGLGEAPHPQMYFAYSQNASRIGTLVVRSGIDSSSVVSFIRGELRGLDADLPLFNVRSVEELMARSVAAPRFNALLIGIFAALALLLASVGIYGVISYSVQQRTHEIGVRVALGAGATDIVKMVVVEGLKIGAAGMAVGLVMAFVLTRLIRTLLYEVAPTDPPTFVAVAAVLMVVALLACYIPARRATKVDPMVALRYE